MSALFGHDERRIHRRDDGSRGLAARGATKGMLFLDEIGELGLDEQAMLLRAIEEKRFLPVGADREVTSDFQLIAGTNRDLQHDVEEGDSAKTCSRASICGRFACRAWPSAAKTLRRTSITN